MKKTYTTPKLTKLADIGEVTQGKPHGNHGSVNISKH